MTISLVLPTPKKNGSAAVSCSTAVALGLEKSEKVITPQTRTMLCSRGSREKDKPCHPRMTWASMSTPISGITEVLLLLPGRWLALALSKG